jgi:hypothetical protein
MTLPRLDGWDTLTWITAHHDSVYQYVAPTLCDSTAGGGICWSVFFVRATTEDPDTFYDSDPDSGYSVDNIAPAVPGGFVMGENTVLTWDASSEPDFHYYTVYGSALDHLDETAVLIDHTIDTSLDVGGYSFAYYLLTASDYAGNESGEAVVDVLTPVPSVVPASFALHPSVPNPFNPASTIRYDLPQQTRVSLRIFDLSGRLVRSLVNGAMVEAGSHEVVWRGQDQTGRKVAAGVYLYRLEAGEFSETRRMTLVK